MIELMEHQLDAIENLGNGKILYGGVGTGKSATVLGYYMKYEDDDQDIYVITTAKKRDSLDWEAEAAKFGIGTEENATVAGVLTVDSWNNIKNYVDIKGAFFIFDEQRLVGHGAWVKSFLKIAKNNRWILLSATPGDTWMDYAPVFIANGFYKNMSQFKLEHVVYEPFMKYPKIRKYIGIKRLEFLRNDVLVEMPYVKDSVRNLNWLEVGYDVERFNAVYRNRWNVFEDRPIKDAAELFRCMRRVVNSSFSRLDMVMDLMKIHPRLIIFYNFDYELEILRMLGDYIDVYECNGHIKDPVPCGDRWVYLVQYIAGAEAWNCTSTDAMVLYSLTYSYKNFQQAQGRIDRLNSEYKNLYYYIFMSNSVIDRAIRKSLSSKKNFNERKFLMEFDKFGEVEAEFFEMCEI